MKKGFKDIHERLILDIQGPSEANQANYVKADVTDTHPLMHAIPNDVYAPVSFPSLEGEPDNQQRNNT